MSVSQLHEALPLHHVVVIEVGQRNRSNLSNLKPLGVSQLQTQRVFEYIPHELMRRPVKDVPQRLPYENLFMDTVLYVMV